MTVKTILEGMDKAKHILAQMAERIPPHDTAAGHHFYFHSRDYTLEMEWTPGLKPYYFCALDKKTSAYMGAGRITPATRRLMTFRFNPGQETTYLGHGDIPEVVMGMEAIHTRATKIHDPARACIEKAIEFMGTDKPFELHFDVADIMCALSVEDDPFHVTCLIKVTDMGIKHFSIHSGDDRFPLVSVKVVFNSDWNFVAPVRIRGQLPRVYKDMDEVLQRISNGSINIVKKEIYDA